MKKVCSFSVLPLFSNKVMEGMNDWELEFIKVLRGRQQTEFQGNDPLLYHTFFLLENWELDVVKMLLERELCNEIEFC